MAKVNSINNKSEELTIDPGASGDSFVQFNINGTGEFRIGVDDTDDSFRISQGSALGTSDTTVIDSAGHVTHGLNPAFSAFKSNDPANVTGDGTVYQRLFGTEIFDQGSNYASSTFTAPTTGKYIFVGLISCYGGTTSHTHLDVRLITSNRTYYFDYVNYGGIFKTQTASGVYVRCNLGIIADMDTSDTATASFMVSGSTKIIDNYAAHIMGILIC